MKVELAAYLLSAGLLCVGFDGVVAASESPKNQAAAVEVAGTDREGANWQKLDAPPDNGVRLTPGGGGRTGC